jgi:hypothetical protein
MVITGTFTHSLTHSLCLSLSLHHLGAYQFTLVLCLSILIISSVGAMFVFAFVRFYVYISISYEVEGSCRKQQNNNILRSERETRSTEKETVGSRGWRQCLDSPRSSYLTNAQRGITIFCEHSCFLTF